MGRRLGLGELDQSGVKGREKRWIEGHPKSLLRMPNEAYYMAINFLSEIFKCFNALKYTLKEL